MKLVDAIMMEFSVRESRVGPHLTALGHSVVCVCARAHHSAGTSAWVHQLFGKPSSGWQRHIMIHTFVGMVASTQLSGWALVWDLSAVWLVWKPPESEYAGQLLVNHNLL